MKELVEKLNEAFVTFSEDANLQVEKGNKAAGMRARQSIFGNRKDDERIPQSFS